MVFSNKGLRISANIYPVIEVERVEKKPEPRLHAAVDIGGRTFEGNFDGHEALRIEARQYVNARKSSSLDVLKS